MRYLLSFFVGVLLSASLYAQSAGDKRSSFSVHAGPSWYLGRFVGITDRADTYRSDLRKGVAWDVNYLGQITGRELKFGLGFLYQESGSHPETQAANFRRIAAGPVPSIHFSCVSPHLPCRVLLPGALPLHSSYARLCLFRL